MSEPTLPPAIERVLRPLPRLIFASRWLQLPLYLGLIIAQGVYVVHFLVELWHLVEAAFGNQEALRMLVAFPFFLAMGAWAAHRGAPLAAADRWRILSLGFLGYYLASFLDFAGLAYITATLERLILYLTPTLVALIGWLAFGRRITRRQALALLVSYAGVALAFGHDLQVGGADIMLGGVLVFGSALAYAMYLVGSGELVARVGAVRLTAYASSVACVLCLLQFVLLRPLDALALPWQVYALSLVNGTLCTVLPVLAVMMAVARIGSTLAAQVGMIGPVSTIVLSLLLLGEPMGPWQVAGTVLVMAGVFMVSQQKTAAR